MEKRTRRRLAVIVALLFALVLLCGVAALLAGPFGPSSGLGSIRNGVLYGTVPQDQKLIQPSGPYVPSPIPHVAIPRHPFMASYGGNNMHNDAYMSDTDEAAGPAGPALQVRSRSQGFGGYGTVAFDSRGRLVAVYSNGRGFQLELMDSTTLQELASYDLPPRPAYFLLQGVMPWQYIGAGTYFYLDNLDRAVVPTTSNTVQVVQVPDLLAQTQFELVLEYDLSRSVVPLSWPHQDSVAWVLPDWAGERYWYATTAGMVGTVEVATGAIQTYRLAGEIVENSPAVAQDGVYIVSDRALYRFNQDGSGQIRVDWRAEYDRGARKKPGVITRGTGTTVTLLGGADGFVTVTDNAEPQIHLLFFRRADGGVVCSTPLFEPGKSATDITVIGFEQATAQGQGTGTYSALVENNWGHQFFPFGRPEPGVTRVDLVPRGDGTYRCVTRWTSGERNLGVFKLSLGNGLLYLYNGEGPFWNARWYLTAVNFRTGQTVYRQLAGTGVGYDNWAGALFLHPDGGVAYSTTIFGLVRLSDTGR